LRAGSGKAAAGLDGYRTDTMIVNDALASAGFDPTPKPGTKDAEKSAQFRRMVDQELAQMQARTGKKATNEEVQGAVDRLMTKTVKKGWLWNGTQRAFEVAEGEDLDFSVKAIPAADRAIIEGKLRARKIPVTDDKLIEIYKGRLKPKSASVR
jgi:hypothetical protein